MRTGLQQAIERYLHGRYQISHGRCDILVVAATSDLVDIAYRLVDVVSLWWMPYFIL